MAPISRYPPIVPFETGHLNVSAIHNIYYEVSGNPAGKPVIVCHGGPGGGSTPGMRQYFDPAAYKIVIFDQRGCGRSTPHASLSDNTTWDLVEDMEKIRDTLNIGAWQVFGGSWGSTLALAYAQTHPDRVLDLVLRGIFTLRRSELEWFYQEGASWIHPEAWAEFIAPIPENERGDFIAAYHKRLTGDDRQEQMIAAKAWSVWEGKTVSLYPSADRATHFADPHFALAFARIENHFFMSGGFFDTDDHLLRHMSKIEHIRGVIVQGRYDIVTPMRTAYAIHKAWPASELIVVDDAGHAATEPGITSALIKATDKFKS